MFFQKKTMEQLKAEHAELMRKRKDLDARHNLEGQIQAEKDKIRERGPMGKLGRGFSKVAKGMGELGERADRMQRPSKGRKKKEYDPFGMF